jgi:hypothetical protein
VIIQDTDYFQQIGIREGEAPFLMGQVTDKDGTAILKADITSIAATITNLYTGEIVLAAGALLKATVWFDTYETGAEWAADETGYNFGWQTDKDYFITTGDDAQFKVEVLVTPVSGEQFYAGWWEVTVKHSVIAAHEPEEEE